MTYASLRSSRENSTAIDAVNGYDYYHQAWVVDGRYVACGHGKPCDCYGTKHEGERIDKIDEGRYFIVSGRNPR